MTDLNTLLQTYIERFESGESTDPTDLLEQAEGRDRARLSALIDGYLEHAAPAQEWDSAAFEGSVAARAAGMVEDAWAAESAALPRELVALRKRAELPRRSLVERLAETLGFPRGDRARGRLLQRDGARLAQLPPGSPRGSTTRSALFSGPAPRPCARPARR